MNVLARFPRLRVLARCIGLFLASLLIIHVVYNGVHSTFLRAESGVYLATGSKWSAAEKRLKDSFSESYCGHYTPIAFGAELGMAALIGPREKWWAFQEEVALSLVSVALVSLFQAIFNPGKAGKFGLLLSAAISSLLVFSPNVIDLIAWPFMAMQLLWAFFTIWTVFWVVKMTKAISETNGDRFLRSALFATICGYTSINCLGLGLATLSALIVVFVTLTVVGRAWKLPFLRSKCFFCLIAVTILLTVAHSAAMILLTPRGYPKHPLPASMSSLIAHLSDALGYVACFLFACIRSLWSPNSFPMPNATLLGREWTYGAAMIMCGIGYGVSLLNSLRDLGARDHALKRLCLFGFSSTALFVTISLVAYRNLEPADSYLGYLVGARYLWPGAILMVGFVPDLSGWIGRSPTTAKRLVSLSIFAGSISGNLVYQKTVFWDPRQVEGFSHQEVWKSLIGSISELQSADLPVPDLSLKSIFEVPFEAKELEPVMKKFSHKLVPRKIKWVNMSHVDYPLWQKMTQRSPSFTRLTKLLGVKPPPETKLPPP